MPTKRRSPWFNARRDPPVNGGDDAMYEHRCPIADNGLITLQRREDIKCCCCNLCQWRGLLRKEGGK